MRPKLKKAIASTCKLDEEWFNDFPGRESFLEDCPAPLEFVDLEDKSYKNNEDTAVFRVPNASSASEVASWMYFVKLSCCTEFDIIENEEGVFVRMWWD